MTVRLRNRVCTTLLFMTLLCGQVFACRAAEPLSDAEAAPKATAEAILKANAENAGAASEANAETAEATPEANAENAGAAPEANAETAPGLTDIESLEASASAGSDSEDGQDSTESAEPATDEKLEALIAQIRGSLPTGNGNWAVYIRDLVNESESFIDSRRMQAASLIKLYIMGAVYENYEDLASQYSRDSLDSYLYSMITVSDNGSANALVNCLGGGDSATGMAVVNDYCMEHGYYETHMGRLLLQSNEYDDNYTSVTDCGHFLQEVYGGNTEENPCADSMYTLLKAQQRRNKIPAQMPAGVSVANKTGELDDVENDAGILYDTENDLILVFMSENLSDVGSAQSTIASLSRQIYDYYCS